MSLSLSLEELLFITLFLSLKLFLFSSPSPSLMYFLTSGMGVVMHGDCKALMGGGVVWEMGTEGM